MSQGAAGDTEPIFARIPTHTHGDVLARVRELGMDMSPQAFWRCLPLADVPYTWVRLIHPAIDEET